MAGITSVILIACYLFACWFGVFKGNELVYEICAAVIGVLITATITSLLLDRQSDAQMELRKKEEEIDKNVKVYESKIQIYTECINKMWAMIADEALTIDEWRNLRNFLVGNVLIHLKEDDLISIKAKIQPLEIKDIDSVINVFAYITEVLKCDLIKQKITDDETREIVDLWSAFNIPPLKTESSEIVIKEDDENAKKKDKIEYKTSNQFTGQFWHMVMLNNNQVKLFKRINDGESPNETSDNCELSLIEYEENSRTNLLKQVKKGDVILLYRRGGYGYVGAFRAKGYRIFDFEKMEETTMLNDEKSTNVIDASDSPSLSKYDIYSSYDQDATLCSNLIVEPLIYVQAGVWYTGGVYRRTISRYPKGYAKILLSRFLYELKQNKEGCKYLVENGEKKSSMSYTAEDFIAFVESCEITEPAKKDSKGNWIDE